MPVIVPLHCHVREAVAQHRVRAVMELPAEDGPFQFLVGRHHQRRHLAHVDGRKSLVEDTRLDLPGHVRIEGDLAHVEAFAQLDNLALDFEVIDHVAFGGGDQSLLMPFHVIRARGILTGA